jgi:hypothetical protein
MVSMDELFRGIFSRTEEETKEVLSAQQETLGKLKEHIVVDDELKGYIDAINFDEVKRIYTRDLRNASLDKSVEAHIIPRTGIVLTNKEGLQAVEGPPEVEMTYMPENDLILVNVHEVRSFARKAGVPLALILVHLLNHEQGHASDSHYIKSTKSGHQVIQIGLQQFHRNIKVKDSKPLSLYEVINVGVNEKRAREVTSEYVTSNPIQGVSKQDVNNFLDLYSGSTGAMYFSVVHFIDVIVSRIARETGVDNTTAWGGVKHAIIYGLNLEDKKVRTMLNVPLGHKFVEQLRTAQAHDVPGILKKYGFSEKQSGYIQSFLVEHVKEMIK